MKNLIFACFALFFACFAGCKKQEVRYNYTCTEVVCVGFQSYACDIVTTKDYNFNNKTPGEMQKIMSDSTYKYTGYYPNPAGYFMHTMSICDRH